MHLYRQSSVFIVSCLTFLVALFGGWVPQSLAQQSEDPSGPKPFDVLNRPVHDRLVYNLVLELGSQFVGDETVPTAKDLNEELEKNRAPVSLPFPGNPAPTENKEIDEHQVYQTMVKSSLIIGTIFDCGKCDKLHVSTAGGVLIRHDGLVLTNHHVVEQDNDGNLNLVAVTHDGQVFPVTEVLSASEADDVALIRIGGDISQLTCAPLANKNAPLVSNVKVMSHPHRHYFVLTEGKVSRYAYDTSRARRDTIWMEITADFGAGSSGSGVFNERGQVVGLVSRVVPLIRKGSPKDSTAPSTRQPKSNVTEVILHRCVPLDAIRKRFAR